MTMKEISTVCMTASDSLRHNSSAVQVRHHLAVPTAAVDGLPARIFLKPAMFLIILKKSVLQFHENIS